MHRSRSLFLPIFLEFVTIQETKFSEVSTSLVHFLWGNSFYEWSFIPVIDNSRFILSIWYTSKGVSKFSSHGWIFLVFILS